MWYKIIMQEHVWVTVAPVWFRLKCMHKLLNFKDKTVHIYISQSPAQYLEHNTTQ